MNDQDIEKRIQELRLLAPRVTLKDVERKIKGATYTMMPSNKVFLCEISLENGFTTRGESAVVSKENFNRELGEDVSYGKAKDAIWPFEAYLLQEKLYQRAKALAHSDVDSIHWHSTKVDGTPSIDRMANKRDAYVTLDGNFTAEDLRYFLAHLEMADEAKAKEVAEQAAIKPHVLITDKGQAVFAENGAWVITAVRGTDADNYQAGRQQSTLRGKEWHVGAFSIFKQDVSRAGPLGPYYSTLTFTFDNSVPREPTRLGDIGLFDANGNLLVVIASLNQHIAPDCAIITINLGLDLGSLMSGSIVGDEHGGN